MIKLLADINLAPSGGFKGPSLNPTSSESAAGLFTQALSKIIGVMTAVAFIWFTFMTVIGAIRLLASGGDKGAVEGARKQITTGIIGVVVVVAAIFLVSLIGTLLGLSNILNPACIISPNGC